MSVFLTEHLNPSPEDSCDDVFCVLLTSERDLPTSGVLLVWLFSLVLCILSVPFFAELVPINLEFSEGAALLFFLVDADFSGLPSLSLDLTFSMAFDRLRLASSSSDFCCGDFLSGDSLTVDLLGERASFFLLSTTARLFS